MPLRIDGFARRPRVREVLNLFKRPKTPRQVERELAIPKLKLEPFLERRLLVPLNPDARKGRLYSLSEDARTRFGYDCPLPVTVDWDSVGWVLAGSRQRYVVLSVLDQKARTSEEIRRRASRYNSRLWRVSTKEILRDLVGGSLAATKFEEPRRYYWITRTGQETLSHLQEFFPLSSVVGGEPAKGERYINSETL